MRPLSKNLLSVDTNPKTVKGQRYGYLTGVLYLSPSDVSGYQVCPMAKTAGCEAACLNTAGRGAMNSVAVARKAKTLAFFENREAFMARLAENIATLVRKAAKRGLVPLVRLNGTSDIRWESVPYGEHANIFAQFPDVQFYDYTKLSNRRGIPANYDLTFSYSGLPGYQSHVERAARAGMRIAVVFRERAHIPDSFIGLRCVDGDDSDLRHIDPQGVVVALYAKGPAKRDYSGFVVDSARRVIPLFAA